MKKWIVTGLLVFSLMSALDDTEKKLKKAQKAVNLLNQENEMLVNLVRGLVDPSYDKQLTFEQTMDRLRCIKMERMEF